MHRKLLATGALIAAGGVTLAALVAAEDVKTAHLTHGRDGWSVQVEQVALWRLTTSQVLLGLLHHSGLCCGPLRRVWVPFGWAGYELLNRFARIDNGHAHPWATFNVDDTFARAKQPDFWADVQRWEQADD